MSDGSWKLEISRAWCCLQRNISTGRRVFLLYNCFKPLVDISLCLRVFWKACCLCFPPSLPPFLSSSLPLSLFVCAVWLVWACLSSILIIFVCFRRMKSRLSGTSWSFWIVDFLSLTSCKIVSDLYRTSYILVNFFPKMCGFYLGGRCDTSWCHFRTLELICHWINSYNIFPKVCNYTNKLLSKNYSTNFTYLKIYLQLLKQFKLKYSQSSKITINANLIAIIKLYTLRSYVLYNYLFFPFGLTELLK